MITPSFALTATERVLPRLALDFTTASLDPRITLTRSLNTATVVNSSGVISLVNADLPRFDYDPVTLLCKGLLIEEARTNVLLSSNDFSTADWTLTNAALGTPTVSPDGTSNAVLVDVSAGGYSVKRTANLAATGVYTMSIYAKAGSSSSVNVFLGETTTLRATFNLNTGAVSAIGAGLTSATAQAAGNGFWRCSVTGTVGGLTSKAGFGLSVAGTFYVYGSQQELGAFATSYIPTTTTALTRNADVATITGTAFSGLWRSGPGSILVRALPSTVSGTRPLVQVDDGTANEIITLRGNTTNPELYIVDGGAAQVQIDAGTIAANTVYRFAAGWKLNECAASINGGNSVLDGQATIPTVTQARLGSDGTNYLNGHIQTIEYYNFKPTNETLQQLSSSAGRFSVLSPILKQVVQS